MKLTNVAIPALSAAFILAINCGVCAAQAQAAAPQAQAAAPPSQTTSAPAPATTMKPPRAGREIKRLTNRLSLTADQQTKLRPIIEAQDKQIDQVQGDTTLSDTQKKQKIASIRQNSRTQIEPLLTDTQKQLYTQMRGNSKPNQPGANLQ
jgi:Spy/CpxP family protein refolding chaperone